MRVRAQLEYLGTNYAGWQLQPNVRTVQGELERALRVAVGEPCRVVASGRTDAGVHALGQVAAFDVPDDVDLHRLRASLNALTDRDITIVSLGPARPDFDPRRDAVSRTYRYVITAGRPPSPFLADRSWHVMHDLSVVALRELGGMVLGEHDFNAFRAADCEAATSTRAVRTSEWSSEGRLLTYEVSANAFLKQMVRTLVGTMVDVVEGRIGWSRFAALLEGGERTGAGRTAPARGLTLVRVDYPD